MQRASLLLIAVILLVSGCVNVDGPKSDTSPTSPDAQAPAPEGPEKSNQTTKRLQGVITQVGFDFPNETGAVFVPGCGSRGFSGGKLDFTVPKNTTKLDFVLSWDLKGQMLFLDVTPPDNSTLVIRDDDAALNNQRIQRTLASPLPGKWNALPCPFGAATELRFLLVVTFTHDQDEAR